MADKKLTIALPNGSLWKKSVNLLTEVGFILKAKDRHCLVEVKDSCLFDRAFILRPQMIPQAVKQGIVDCGICGWDCVVEDNPFLLHNNQSQELKTYARLYFGRKSSNPARVVMFGRSDFDYNDREGVKIVSEYPNIANWLYPQAKISFSYGSTEALVYSQMYEYGIGVTETETTINIHNLDIVKEIVESPVALISNKPNPQLEKWGYLLEKELSGLNDCPSDNVH